MKQKLILLFLSILAFNYAEAQGNWLVNGESVSPNIATISSNGTVSVSGSFTWVSSVAFLNDKHLVQLNYALPPSLFVSTGTPSLSYTNNTPVSGVTFTLNAGGWVCDFAPGMVIAPGTEVIFKVADINIKEDKPYNNQQVTHFIKFVASPGGESYTDNSATVTFNTVTNTPLPMNILNFEASLIEKNGADQVQLDWSMAAELNVSNYVVQRSQNSLEWEDVLTVASKGNSSTKVDYVDFDTKPLFGLTYYRIKQVDRDKYFLYSDVRQVNRFTDGKISLYPNPTQELLNVEFNLDQKTLIEVKIMNAAGQTVQSVISWKEKGTNAIEMNIKQLANGVYNVNVYKNNELFSTAKAQKY